MLGGGGVHVVGSLASAIPRACDETRRPDGRRRVGVSPRAAAQGRKGREKLQSQAITIETQLRGSQLLVFSGAPWASGQNPI